MTVACTTIVVRSTELDSYGHVNNARYVEYFEWGRFDWLAATGLAERLEPGGTSYVVVDLHVSYRKEARMGETLTLSTYLSKIGRSSVVVTQTLTKAEGVVVANGEVTLVAFDPTTRRARRLPEAHLEILDKVLVASE